MKLSSLWDISFSRDKRDKEGIEREGGSFKNWNVNICSIINYPRALRRPFTCYDQDYTQTVGVLIDILPHQMRHQHSPLRRTFFMFKCGSISSIGTVNKSSSDLQGLVLIDKKWSIVGRRDHFPSPWVSPSQGMKPISPGRYLPFYQDTFIILPDILLFYIL